jgi:hypothetical protein
MKRIGWLAIAVIAVLAWHLHTPTAPTVATPQVTVPHVRTLASGEERREVAGRIAAAQASRAQSSTPPPRLPPITDTLTSGDPDTMKQTVRGAMREVVAHLMTCYESSLSTRGRKELHVVAHLTLTGDPDIGTLIDAPQLFDDQAEPLPSQLDDCLRDTLQSLELPPLAEGDHVDIAYPFTFRPAITDDAGSDDADDDDDNEL